MMVRYAVLYVESETGRTVEFGESDFTKLQAVSAANAVVHSPWVERAWVVKRVYDLITSQTIHTVK